MALLVLGYRERQAGDNLMTVGVIVCLSNYATTIAVLAQMFGAWERVWVCC